MTAHKHAFVQHPNPDWSTHMACTICGWAVHKSALAQPAILDKQLSPALLAERQTLLAARAAASAAKRAAKAGK